MLEMVIDLVTREKQQVGLQFLDVLNNVAFGYVSTVFWIDRVARERSHYDNVFVEGIFADGPGIVCVLSVSHPVFNIFRAIPAFNPERSCPALLDDLCFGDLFPCTLLSNFEPDIPVLARIKRIQLGGQFHNVILDRV